MEEYKFIKGKLCKIIFCRYIKKGGRIIYPRKSKFFRFYVPVDAA